eukprot:TRINITY_DN81038_c0_g1_i1.p1 TRINITY_DN81038_c0_g1~~TRINITY_DN81038_c0_g1_i1.p1  ORF type:complete len:219 (+),score=19.24 TRINITY_DN81038_c0_g1_i1:63-659(+)
MDPAVPVRSICFPVARERLQSHCLEADRLREWVLIQPLRDRDTLVDVRIRTGSTGFMRWRDVTENGRVFYKTDSHFLWFACHCKTDTIQAQLQYSVEISSTDTFAGGQFNLVDSIGKGVVPIRLPEKVHMGVIGPIKFNISSHLRRQRLLCPEFRLVMHFQSENFQSILISPCFEVRSRRSRGQRKGGMGKSFPRETS